MADPLVLALMLATAPPSPALTSCTDLRPALAAIAAALESSYVLPARGTEGAARLRAIARRGDVSHVCGDGSAKAAVLTRTTRDALNDLHLRVAFGPPESSKPPVEPDADALADNLGIEEVGRLPGGIGCCVCQAGHLCPGSSRDWRTLSRCFGTRPRS